MLNESSDSCKHIIYTEIEYMTVLYQTEPTFKFIQLSCAIEKLPLLRSSIVCTLDNNGRLNCGDAIPATALVVCVSAVEVIGPSIKRSCVIDLRFQLDSASRRP